MKDFNVKLTVRNNRLLSLIEEKFGTSAEMCRQIAISPSKVAAYMTMKQKPVGKSGWKKCAIDLSTALGVHPDEIWPQHLQNVVLKTSTAEMHLDSDEVRQIALDATFDQAEARDLILKMAKGLPDK
jgi:lambda repressor-like predicted transcriptional regulator